MIPSSGHYSSIQRDHVRSVGDKLKHHEHITLHRSDPITYDLWAKTRGETMSTLSWSIQRNYAHPVGDKTINNGSASSNGNTHHLLLWVDIWMTLLALLLQTLVHYHILSVIVQSVIRGDGDDKTRGGVPTEYWSFKVSIFLATSCWSTKASNATGCYSPRRFFARFSKNRLGE